jgi:glycopeptide antibiotics resistance protein
MLKKRERFAIVLLAVYFAMVVAVVVFKLPFSGPLGEDIRIVNLIPLKGSFDDTGAFIWREVVLNILIFVPFGIYLSILKPNWRSANKIPLVLGTTVTFEVVQFAFSVGRFDITDIIGNTFGGIIGIVFYAVIKRLFKGKTAVIVLALATVSTLYYLARFVHLFYLSHFVMRGPPI